MAYPNKVQVLQRLRIAFTGDGSTAAPELDSLLAGAQAFVDGVPFRAIPEALRNEAYLRLVGYLYDAPEGASGRGYANAWHNSGAEALVARYVVRRVGTIPAAEGAGLPDPASMSGSALPAGTAGALLYHNGTSWVLLARQDNGQVLGLANGLPAWVAQVIGLPPGAGGDVLYHDGQAWRVLSKGADGQVLELASGVPTWGDGLPEGAAGALLAYDGSKWRPLAKGADGQFLSIASGALTWAAAPGGGNVDLSAYAKRSELTVRDGYLWSVNQNDMLPGDTDGEWQFLNNAQTPANVVPAAANAGNIHALRIGRLAWPSGDDFFLNDATADYRAALAGLADGSPLVIKPFDPSTAKADNANFWTFTASGAPVFTDNTEDDEDYFTIPGAAVATGAPQNNNNAFWQFEFETSNVEVLGQNIVNPAGLVARDTVEAPDGALARQGGQVRHWPLEDMRAHVLGPDTRELPIGTFGHVAAIPSVAGKFSISGSGNTRTLNLTWASAEQESHLAYFFTPGERFVLGSWRFVVTGTVNKNTVAYGGFGAVVTTLSGNPPTSGNQGLKVAGRLIHWDGAGTAGDVLYHDGTSWKVLPKGSDGQVLKLASGIPSWAADAQGGGASLPSGVSGDVLYHNGTSWVALNKGSDGQVLELASGIPSWADQVTGLPSGASGDIAYHNGTSWVVLNKGTDGQVLELASGVPTWADPSGGGTETKTAIFDKTLSGSVGTGAYKAIGNVTDTAKINAVKNCKYLWARVRFMQGAVSNWQEGRWYRPEALANNSRYWAPLGNGVSLVVIVSSAGAISIGFIGGSYQAETYNRAVIDAYA